MIEKGQELKAINNMIKKNSIESNDGSGLGELMEKDKQNKDYGKCNLCGEFFDKTSITHKTHAKCLDDKRLEFGHLQLKIKNLEENIMLLVEFLPDELNCLFSLGFKMGNKKR